jgi:hypothetical protein
METIRIRLTRLKPHPQIPPEQLDERTPATPEQLDATSQITPQDVEPAKAAAQRDGSPLLNAMLNAKGG